MEGAQAEGHHKYIDLLYIVSGNEQIGVTPLIDQIPMISNKENDYDFYDTDVNMIPLTTGMFAIFYPGDLHMPCLTFETPNHVKKVVIKIKI